MNNDLISREALKEALGKSTVTIIGYGEAILLDTANELIDNVPTVIKDSRPNICLNCEHCCALTVNSDGEVKVMCNLGAENCDNQKPYGEWKFDSEHTEFGNPYGTYKCSCCGGHSSDKYPYCFWCGAKMKGGAE